MRRTHGTGCVLADPNCVGNVLGGKGMAWAGETNTPLKILQQVSHRIPERRLWSGGAEVLRRNNSTCSKKCSWRWRIRPFGFDERAAVFSRWHWG